MAFNNVAFEKEKYGFPRGAFAFELNEHVFRIIENKLYIDDDERLRVHLTLHCSHCNEKETVRNRFPYGYPNVDEAVGYCKMMVLAKFVSDHQKV